MPKNSVHKLAVKSVDETAFSLHSVTSRPRQCTPTDLQLANENLKLEPLTNDPPERALALVRYVLTDFFTQLHRSGLYNRQMALWEALARVVEVHIERLNQGFIAKIELPIWEIRFVDAQGKKPIVARFLDETAPNLVDANNPKDALRFLQDSIRRAEKLKVENPQFAGLILCCCAPVPKIIVENILKLTGDDAISRYQSILPAAACHLDLIEEQGDQFALVLPTLPDRIKSVSSNPVVSAISDGAGEKAESGDEIKV